MPSAKRLKEIHQARKARGVDRVAPPGKSASLRALLFVASITGMAGSVFGLIVGTKHHDTVSIPIVDINEQMTARLPYGASEVRVRAAKVTSSHGIAQFDAVVADGTWSIPISLTGGIEYDYPSQTLTLSDPDTVTGEIAKIGRDAGDAAREYVGGTWQPVQAVVTTFAKVASLDFFDEAQFETKAKRTLWEMPIFEIPLAYRARLDGVNIFSITADAGSIVMSVNSRKLGGFGVFLVILLATSGATFFVLRSYPDLARG